MRFSVHAEEVAGLGTTLHTDLCAVILFEGEVGGSGDGGGSAALAALDGALGGILKRAAEEEQFTGKKGQSLSLHTHGKIGAGRVLLLGVGKAKDFQAPDVRHWMARVAKAAAQSRSKSVAVVPPRIAGTNPELAERLGQLFVEGVLLSTYQFDRYLAGERKKPTPIEAVTLAVSGSGLDAAAVQRGLTRGEVVARWVMVARDLTNEGASELPPRKLAERASQIASERGMEIEVLGPRECTELGMGLYLSVARGSDEEPRFIHLTYKPRDAAPRRRIALVGKSVTFDAGGLSLKTNEGMLDMKMDMGGGAAVLGAIGALAELGCPDEVHAILPACENMPSGRAYKLGDLMRSMAGKTVELNNADAEGRLTLADAITFALQKIKPDELLDFATLTGASMVALGPYTASVLSNRGELAGRFLQAAQQAGEDMWQLPLNDRLFDMLKSDFADMKNTGERYGGTITASLFLREFVGDTPWLHVDLAGPVHATKEWGHHVKGATGFGVASIVEYLVPRGAESKA
ncbi:MAG: leucyl aminopeptidase [Polyangia bacterium]